MELQFCFSLSTRLPLLGLGSKSTSLSPGFCIPGPREHDTICLKFDLFPGSFVSSWLIVLMN